MKKFNSKIALSFFLLFFFIVDGKDYSNRPDNKINKFQHGEELIYSLKYGFIHGGNATLTLHRTLYNNKDVFHARLYAKTMGVTDKLFKVKDIYESYFSPETCLPYKSIRDISEGNYKYYNEVFFSHQDSSLVSQKGGKYTVPPNILDVISSLYYLRSMDLDTLKYGETINFITFFGDEIFPFPLRYRGKEYVSIKLGKIYCHRFDPVVEVGRIFESEDDMTFWVSADSNLVPIRVRFNMVVGSILCDLTKYTNLIAKLEMKE